MSATSEALKTLAASDLDRLLDAAVADRNAGVGDATGTRLWIATLRAEQDRRVAIAFGLEG